MVNVLLDRESLQVVGLNRPALPYEVVIDNVDPTGLTKTIQVPVNVDKVDGNGNQLYVLPQPDKEVVNTISTQVETPNELSADGKTQNTPIIIDVIKQIPQLDANGKQITYQPTSLQETTETKDFYGNPTTPIMVDVVQADGSVKQEQKTDESGVLLYKGQMAFGNPLPCFTTEVVQEQKTDAAGNKLFYETVSEDVTSSEPQPALEITESDPAFVEGLEKAVEVQEQSQTASFDQNQSAFTYSDIVSCKEKQILSNSFFANCQLYEEMDQSIFVSGGGLAFGLDVVSIPANGKVLTNPITLSAAVSSIKVQSESSNLLTISIGSSETDLQPIDSQLLDRDFSAAVSSVVVQFENPNNTRVDLISFALLF